MKKKEEKKNDFDSTHDRESVGETVCVGYVVEEGPLMLG